MEERSEYSVHDFASKLRQPSLMSRVKEYVEWQTKLRYNQSSKEISAIRGYAPVSINIDLTTACNYACDHCVDWEILNQPFKFQHEKLLSSIDNMHKRGLKSAILIGGGEPTLYPRFEEVVEFLIERGIQVAVVSNGTGMHKIDKVAHLFGQYDWVRLSLDSGTDATFQAMHKPKRPITLEKICNDVHEVKGRNPDFKVGFSYIVTWDNAFADGRPIVPNIHEVVLAARLARDNRFNYLSIKPFLERALENSAEMISLNQSLEEYKNTIKKIREAVAEAKKLETGNFKIRETTNLLALENGTMSDYTKQPRNCHMTFFHAVLSPLGLFNCPVYRNVHNARLGSKNAYATEEEVAHTEDNTAKNIMEFDAAHECRNVTCLYNSANWLIEDLIRNPEKLDELRPLPEKSDFFF